MEDESRSMNTEWTLPKQQTNKIKSFVESRFNSSFRSVCEGQITQTHCGWRSKWTRAFLWVLSFLLKMQWGRKEKVEFNERTKGTRKKKHSGSFFSNSNPKHEFPAHVGMRRSRQETCVSAKSINSCVTCYPLSLHKAWGRVWMPDFDSGRVLK